MCVHFYLHWLLGCLLSPLRFLLSLIMRSTCCSACPAVSIDWPALRQGVNRMTSALYFRRLAQHCHLQPLQQCAPSLAQRRYHLLQWVRPVSHYPPANVRCSEKRPKDRGTPRLSEHPDARRGGEASHQAQRLSLSHPMNSSAVQHCDLECKRSLITANRS